MKQRLIAFMQGRYGNDELNILLLISSLLLNLLSPISEIFSGLGMVCICYAIYRMFSKNIYQRRCENAKILPYVSFIKAKLKNKGKARLFMCPKCKRTLRIPKGKGKVTVNCPCGNAIKRKS
ncbi:MAG: hypothetical protein IJ297_05295 [Clostridia bacterium]|nr:hypothetical protein [Clostridia bacterium]